MPFNQNLLLRLLNASSGGILPISDIPTDNELWYRIGVSDAPFSPSLLDSLSPVIGPICLVVSSISYQNPQVFFIIFNSCVWSVLRVYSLSRSWATLPRSYWDIWLVWSTLRGSSRGLINFPSFHLCGLIILATLRIPPARLCGYIVVICIWDQWRPSYVAVIWWLFLPRLNSCYSLVRR